MRKLAKALLLTAAASGAAYLVLDQLDLEAPAPPDDDVPGMDPEASYRALAAGLRRGDASSGVGFSPRIEKPVRRDLLSRMPPDAPERDCGRRCVR